MEGQCFRQTLGLGQNEFRFYLHWMWYLHLRKLDNAENHENYYVNVTTRHTKHQQHDIKKSCHPFLAYKHPLVLYFALQVGRSTSQYNYWAVHFNHIVNIIVIPPPAVLPRR